LEAVDTQIVAKDKIVIVDPTTVAAPAITANPIPNVPIAHVIATVSPRYYTHFLLSTAVFALSIIVFNTKISCL
jgi:hypothetical protein